MVPKRFSVHVSLRVALLALSLLLLVQVFSRQGYPVLTLLLAALVVAQLTEMLRYINKTNAELTRFLDAARYADYGQRFATENVGTGFDELGVAFTHIMARFRTARQQQEQQLRHLQALVEQVPVPLLSVQSDGRVDLRNSAARRLFADAHISRLPDLAQFGHDFAAQLDDIDAGERRLVNLVADGTQQQLTVAATKISQGNQFEKLISLQNIQTELDDVQLQAWQDLVRVLTHEIMNSITPVTSLATTAGELVNDAIVQVRSLSNVEGVDAVGEQLADIKSAVDTVARRADGLLQFVQSYRHLTQLAAPQTTVFEVEDVLQRVAKLLSADWQQQAVELIIDVEPEGLEIRADLDMLEQVLINLLSNAGQALTATANGRVKLVGRLNKRGHVVLEVVDNGPGIASEIATKVFVPFFTTKHNGSGVGLALTRQVMIAHGGAVAIGEGDSGGARVTLTF